MWAYNIVGVSILLVMSRFTKLGVESRKRRSAISRAGQNDVGVQEMPITRHAFARRFPFFFRPDYHSFSVSTYSHPP